jgi:hypothetical protein
MSKLDKIKPDTTTTMTAIFRKAFLGEDCDPTCHGCYKKIAVGQKFQLAKLKQLNIYGRPTRDPVEYKDEMLCMKCDPKTLTAKRIKEGSEAYIIRTQDLGYRSGGYSRPSRP